MSLLAYISEKRAICDAQSRIPRLIRRIRTRLETHGEHMDPADITVHERRIAYLEAMREGVSTSPKDLPRDPLTVFNIGYVERHLLSLQPLLIHYIAAREEQGEHPNILCLHEEVAALPNDDHRFITLDRKLRGLVGVTQDLKGAMTQRDNAAVIRYLEELLEGFRDTFWLRTPSMRPYGDLTAEQTYDMLYGPREPPLSSAQQVLEAMHRHQ